MLPPAPSPPWPASTTSPPRCDVGDGARLSGGGAEVARLWLGRWLGKAASATNNRGTRAPHTVQDINGKDVQLSSFKGKVVLMTNVASACGYTVRTGRGSARRGREPETKLRDSNDRRPTTRSWLRCTTSTRTRAWRSSRGRATSACWAGVVCQLCRMLTRPALCRTGLGSRSRAPRTRSASSRPTRASRCIRTRWS